MATIQKMYLHNATTSNTGTMPSNSPATISGLSINGNASGASTARNMDATIGVANPDTESTFTANPDSSPQVWGVRRFVSPPLVAHTFTNAEGNWTFSFARSESNTNHNGAIRGRVYFWSPSSGTRVGTAQANFSGATFLATAETAESLTSNIGSVGGEAISDGDIIVLDIYSAFTQGMNTAYTEQFAYDGTTEASTTTCASFLNMPVAVDLFVVTSVPYVDRQIPSLLAQ
jgi:hypothetical protein